MTNATRKPRTRRPILHVHIIDDDTSGRLLADVDAPSVADGLAYYLWSRRIDEAATEASILRPIAWDAPDMKPPGDRVAIVYERRHPVSGVLELALSAHVEGDCPSTAECAR